MRARSLKPGYFKNEQLGALPPLTRILFAGLWGMADREGRMEDRPLRIKADVLPFDNCDVEAMLRALEHAELIRRYSVAGRQYITIPTFLEHQHPHFKEVQSAIPPPSNGGLAPEGVLSDTAKAPESPPLKETISVPNQGHKALSRGGEPGGLLTPDSGLLTPDSGDSVTERASPTLDDLLQVWNENRGTLPAAGKTRSRAVHAAARLREIPDLERWRRAIRWLAADDFHAGGGTRGWKADFDWILKPDKLIAIEEKAASGRQRRANPAGLANFHQTPGRYDGVKIEKVKVED